jgi:hypothetical protein
MADNGIAGIFIGIFLHEFLSAGKSYLVDVFLHFFLRHAHAVIADGKCLFVLIQLHFYGEVARFFIEFRNGRKRFELLRGIYGIGNQLAQENFLVGVKEFLDDGKNILGMNTKITRFHAVVFCCVVYLIWHLSNMLPREWN